METVKIETPVEKIRLRIIGPFAIAFFLVLGGSVLGVYWFQEKTIEDDTRRHLAGVRKAFQKALARDAELLRGMIELIKSDENLQKAWLAKDRDELFRRALPFFGNISSKHRITHYYFHNLDKTNFLRMHHPAHFGDPVKRSSLARAEREGKPVYGVELGDLGGLALRLVSPWRIGGRLTGYIELGEWVNHITPGLSEILGDELFLTVEKQYLDRAKWEEYMKTMGKTGRWEQFPQFVVINSTMKKIPPGLGKYMQPRYIKSKYFIPQDLGTLPGAKDGRTWHGGFVPILDVGKRNIGSIVVLRDVTQEKASLRTLTAALAGLAVVIGGALLGLSYVYVGAIEKKLVTGHRDLTDEVDERKKAEEALKEAQARLESRVQARTVQLMNVNETLKNEIVERNQVEKQLRISNEKLKGLFIRLHSVREEERSRIAREVHDNLGQMLTTLKLELSLLEDGFSPDQESLKEDVQSLLNLIDVTISTMRRIAGELRPASLDVFGLSVTLQWYAEEFQSRTGIRCELDLNADDSVLSKNGSTEIFRVFQEAMTNVTRHANATRVNISFKDENGHLALKIKDNGKGIAERQIADMKSIGLVGMRERAYILRGTLDISGSPGGGTTVVLTVPREAL